MIQEFSLDNYLSFGNKQTISFVATSDKSLAENLIVEPKPGVRLLRMAVIYGANASGKSNLLQAMQALWILLFSPTSKEHEKILFYNPFELRKGEPTRFWITFWAIGRKFEYNLEYDSEYIIYEKMTYSSDKGVQSDLYERRKGEQVIFGSTTKIKAKQRDDFNRETLRNHTVLSTLNKKNIDVPIVFRELYDWIKNNVHELDIYNEATEIAEQAEKNPKLKSFLLDLLNKADLNIYDFKLIDIDIPEDVIEMIKEDDDLSEFAKEKYLKPRKQLMIWHKTADKNLQVSFRNESSGTRYYLHLARLLFDLKDCGCLAMEDELEDSMHYDLLIHFLQTYLQTESKSQLIFTTHNQMLLDEDWIIRRDMVWLVDKDRDTAYSSLTRASDQGIHKNASLMNAYRIGKLGAKPILGSTLLNNEEL